MSLRCWQAPGPRGWGRLQSPEKPRRLITDWKQGKSGCSGDFFSFPIPGSEGDRSMLPTLLQSKVAAFLKSKLNIHPWERNPFTPACLVQLPYKMQLRKLQATYSKKKKKVISQRPGLSWEWMEMWTFSEKKIGWVEGLRLCFDRIVHLKQILFSALKSCVSRVNITSVGYSLLFRTNHVLSGKRIKCL